MIYKIKLLISEFFFTMLLLALISFCIRKNAVAQSKSQTKALDPPKLRNEFLQLCNVAANRLNLPDRRMPYTKKPYTSYIDSYIVRALDVSYDITGNKKYLNAAKIWCDKMVAYQRGMVPRGLYYMNYGREPFDTTGDCYNGDNGSIATAIITTAMTGNDPMTKEYYINSVRVYAELVLSHYTGSGGGITDGIWPHYEGEWWCSTGTVAPVFFLLYKATGIPTYLKAGLNTIKWLNKQDLDTVGPFPLKQQGPSLPMYVFEAYSCGWPYIVKDKDLLNKSKKQVKWLEDWAKNYRPKSSNSHQLWWGSKYGGIPVHLMVLGGYTNDKGMLSLADKDLNKIVSITFEDKGAQISQFTAFAMLSMAEKLKPGSIYFHEKK